MICSPESATVRPKWNTPEDTIPESYTRQEHLRILQKVVEGAGEFDPRTQEVYAALEYLQSASTRRWGFTVFKEGLEKNASGALPSGLDLVRRHLGFRSSHV